MTGDVKVLVAVAEALAGPVPTACAPEAGGVDVGAVLRCPSVVRAIRMEARDALIRASYVRLRAGGVPSREAYEALTGPWTDEAGREYWIGVHRVKSVVYGAS